MGVEGYWGFGRGLGWVRGGVWRRDKCGFRCLLERLHLRMRFEEGGNGKNPMCTSRLHWEKEADLLLPHLNVRRWRPLCYNGYYATATTS